MAGYLVDDTRKVTTHRLFEMKQGGKKIAMLTSYDYTMAQIVDGAGADVILIGDSASNTMAGNLTTVPITLAIRIMQETGCDALKLEGGEEIIPAVKLILDAGIPVMGHLGLTPQSINKFGTYAVRAKEAAEAEKLRKDALALADVGCFAIVLEKIPALLAQEVTTSVNIPIIGIGAGGACDGQVLVVHDMLGMNKGFSPKFLRRYANLFDVMTDAIGNYVSDVKSRDFPNADEQY